MAEPGAGGTLNLTALGVGAAGLTTVIASLSTTGTIGRFIRNDPEELTVAIVLVILGAAALTAAGLPLTSGLVEVVFSIVGLGLTVAGLLIGAMVGALTARKHPEQGTTVTAQYSKADRHLKGTVQATTLKAESRVVVIVDGLRVVGGGDHYRPNTLLQTYAGPNGDGNVKVPIDLNVPAGRFDAIGINSWTETDSRVGDPENARPCSYERRVSTYPEQRSTAKIGCLMLPLSPVPRRPRVTLSWQGAGSETARVEARVLARNVPAPLYAGEVACTEKDLKIQGGATEPTCARRDERGANVAFVVVSGPPATGKPLYRANLEPNSDGYLKESVQLAVPDKVQSVCAVAVFVHEGGPYPSFRCPTTRVTTGRAVAEVYRPARGGKARKPPKNDDP